MYSLWTRLVMKYLILKAPEKNSSLCTYTAEQPWLSGGVVYPWKKMILIILYYYHSNKDTEADKIALVVRNSCDYHLRSCTGSLCEYSMMGDIANGVSGFVKSHTITSPAPFIIQVHV